MTCWPTATYSAETLPFVLKASFVCPDAATDPETATDWVTDPFVTACVRSSCFGGCELARDAKSAPPPTATTSASASSRPGHVVTKPLSTVMKAFSLGSLSSGQLRVGRVRESRRHHGPERVREGGDHRQSAQIWKLPCDIDKGRA